MALQFGMELSHTTDFILFTIRLLGANPLGIVVGIIPRITMEWEELFLVLMLQSQRAKRQCSLSSTAPILQLL